MNRLSRALFILAVALLGLVSESTAQAEQAAPGRMTFAVVVGNNQSLGRRRPDLHYADDDAARYFAILQTLAPGRVALLTELDRDSQRLFPTVQAQATAPTRRALEGVGRRLASQVRAANAAGHETEVYFIFAGHGDVAEGEGFIELSDGRFRSSELKAWLGAIPFTRAHVILDSCNSFFMLGVRKPGGRHFATSEDAARTMAARLPNVGVFLSTSAEGEAFEWSEIQSGIFSHVVRSGLLGAADANSDGSVSYLELAAFVDTATASVRNPNMRPHVFARGPGADDRTPIARLQSMTDVRRFELGDNSSLRLRVRDENGLPLLDAHTEHGMSLKVALPESWLHGAVVERAAQDGSQLLDERTAPQLYAVPEPASEATGAVTLAMLEDVSARSAGRGPDETFRTLFAQPFGPSAVVSYIKERQARPPEVYGVSKEDAQRMELVLDEIARAEYSRRINEGIGTLGCGVLLGGAGVGVLQVDSTYTRGQKLRARIAGGALLALGSVFAIGGTSSLFKATPSEEAALDFRRVQRAGGDTAQAFAVADKRLQKLVKTRKEERLAGAIIGTLSIVGSTTGLVVSEVMAEPHERRMGARLGWGSGIVIGSMMVADAFLMRSPAETLTKIWRDDPSLNHYQPSLSVSSDGAFLSLSGAL